MTRRASSRTALEPFIRTKARWSIRWWCEAVVQRVPDYLDGTDAPEVARERLKSEANKQFGRRFVIRSFRWVPGGGRA